MKQFVYIIILAPSLLLAQEKGVQFEQGLNWQQVQGKAKAENKYIFVDCFATWCEPCKVMDRDVYPSEKVGEYFNKTFICVKMQMDSSKQDNEGIKRQYAEANEFLQQYKITALPSFLFFSPSGRIVHRGQGFKKKDDFITLATDAVNPDKQYYTLLENYQKGEMNYAMMPSLARACKALGAKGMADKIAQDYINNYLLKVKEEELNTKDNLEFIQQFSQSSKGNAFAIFFRHTDKIDKIMGRTGYARGHIDYIITKEEIDPKLWRVNDPALSPVTDKPDWEKITTAIRKKYGKSYAERNVINAQIRWYNYKKDWPEIVKYNIKKIDKYGLDTAGLGWLFTNNMIWDVIFTHSNDKTAINKGIHWMEIINKAHPNDAADMDTYANLLYKIGRVEEALDWEKKAEELEKGDAVKQKRIAGLSYQETLEKMKKGIPTWPVKSQKPPIDSSVFDKWPRVGNPQISNDGNYALYPIQNQPVGVSTLVIQSTHTNWKMEIPWASRGSITQDSRRAIFVKSRDSLGIIELGGTLTEYIADVLSFQLPKSGTGEWLAYQLSSPGKQLIVQNLVTGNKKAFVSVNNYLFSEDGKALVLQTETKKDSTTTQSLIWMTLSDGHMISIWKGANAVNFMFDAASEQLAFTAQDTINNEPVNSLWYYKRGTDKAVAVGDDHSPGIETNLKIDKIQGFSNDGKKIFFSLKERSNLKPSPNTVKVDIWSYADAKLQSQQLAELDPTNFFRHQPHYTSVINIQDHHLIRLEQEDDRIGFQQFPNEDNESVVLIFNSKGDALNEWNWNSAAQVSVYLVSTKNGVKKLINRNLAEKIASSYILSPGGKYVVYYDAKQKNYFSYAISSGIVRKITQGIRATWTTNDQDDIPESSYRPIGYAGWLNDDTALIIYDQNDIFKIDPSGSAPAVNLTNGYGRRHNIVFRLAMDHRRILIRPDEKLILNSFNRNNKDDGFYSITLGKKAEPELLIMQSYVYKGPDESLNINSIPPIKARDADAYLVRRMSASESPNYFYTSNFVTFTVLSNVHPEAKYNWLITELMTWKTLDGSLSQGILYKPEDFDRKKKYPVIFYYYEKLSESLHGFIEPEASIGPINIPYFVSKGYLVFVPDIHYKIGYSGQGVFNSVVSAANYLSKMPWVDPKRFGIQGHSRGGFETNYLVTHTTHLFAAAMSASGYSDFISLYGGVRTNGTNRASGCELGSQRIGATLWERPDLYIKNSPVFRADKVRTPLLMMNNKGDDDIPFAQGVEFFTALRRLGKKVWMLQYDGEGHVIFRKAAGDLTVRMLQFFDHYLKGAPAPKWMTRGIPAKMKGIDMGYESDYNTKEPGPGLVNY